MLWYPTVVQAARRQQETTARSSMQGDFSRKADLRNIALCGGVLAGMDRPKSRLAPILAVALMLAPMFYVVVYLLLITRVPVSAGSVFVRYDVRYRYGDTAVKWVFWPAHQLDRQVRPGLWTSPSEIDSR